MRRFIAALLLTLVVLAVWLASPLPIRGFESRPSPATSYAEALRLVDALRAEDTQPSRPNAGQHCSRTGAARLG